MAIEKLLPGSKPRSFDPISGLTDKISEVTASRSLSDEKITGYAISTESLDSNKEQVLTNVYSNFESTIKAISQDFDISLEEFQIESASIAGIIGANPKAFLASKPKAPSTESIMVSLNVDNSFIERPISLEAYDERENRNAQQFSVVYNLLASRQDDLGETFFPTIVVNPNEVGVTISVKLFYAYNDLKRSVTGSLADYARKNIVRAYANSEILHNELTKAVPVLRTTGGTDDNTAQFVPVADVPAWAENLGNGVTVPTAALKVDNKIDLLGISQTNELLNSGIMGPSDTLDTNIRLGAVYIKFTDGTNTDIIRFDVSNLPGSIFTYSPQGNYRRMILNLDTDAIVAGASTTDVNGAALSYLTELATNDARLQLTISGSVVIDKGETIVNSGSVDLAVMRDATTGALVTGATQAAFAAKIATAEVIGYTLQAYRANSNIRQRGQLLDSQVEYRTIPLNYRSPLSAIMPAISGTAEDSSALQTLITATGIRVSNEAVTSLLDAQLSLSSYAAIPNANGDLPEISPIGQFHVKPTYFTEVVDLEQVVDSEKSHERIKDIRAAIVEKIRYFANEMYRSSEYKSASMVLTGNIGFKPTVIVGTDTVIYNYIMADGDIRTLGESFDVRIVSTVDARMAGKIFISFGVFDSSRNTTINPLNFGNMLWSPELTVNMPVSRDGSVSNEMIVAPRFLHFVNLPVLTVLDVIGLPAVTNKVSSNFHNV
jgi:hypothetical protein